MNMKKISGFILMLFVSLFSLAQSGTKVNWTYTVKKLSEKQYELKLTATVMPGWHLYSQIQSKDAIALPTKISFSKNPLIVFNGSVKEVGKVIDDFDKATQSKSRFYSNKVEFIQIVTLKSKVKTVVNGNVEFMVCDDRQCLPPDNLKFTFRIDK